MALPGVSNAHHQIHSAHGGKHRQFFSLPPVEDIMPSYIATGTLPIPLPHAKLGGCLGP